MESIDATRKNPFTINVKQTNPQECAFPQRRIAPVDLTLRPRRRLAVLCRISTISFVDVFSATPLQGNPLAVVMNTCGLTTEQMQAIAREFNLSETTFVERRAAEVERTEGVRVRIFTTLEELRFAGHPTLGTACVLKMFAPETVQGDTVTLALNVGPVPVRFEQRDAGSTGLFGEMTQRDPEFGAELDRKDVARLTGLAVDDLDRALPPQVVSTGTAFAIVVLRTAAALARLNVNQNEATAWLRERGARWFYVLGPDHDQNQGLAQYRARMQFYGGEDPATGSAAGCAISLPRGSRRRSFGHARASAPGRRDRPAQRSFPVGAKRIGEGPGCARRGQHRSCGKRTAFPAVMHMLSTEIHLRKLQRALILAVFHLLHADFQSGLRFVFPLFSNSRDSYSFDSLQTIP